MTRKTTFFERSSFKFNNLGRALGIALKFYTSVAKELKLKLTKFCGLITRFVDNTGEKLVGGPFCTPYPILNSLKHEIFNMKSLLNVNLYTWSAFISNAICLVKTSDSCYKYSQPFLMPKILWYAQNYQCVQNSIFSSGKHIFPNSLITS